MKLWRIRAEADAIGDRPAASGDIVIGAESAEQAVSEFLGLPASILDCKGISPAECRIVSVRETFEGDQS